MNIKQQLIDSCTQDCMGVRQVNAQQLVNQTVGECILAILATDTRDVVYTTFDKMMADAVTSRVVDHVRKHFRDENV